MKLFDIQMPPELLERLSSLERARDQGWVLLGALFFAMLVLAGVSAYDHWRLERRVKDLEARLAAKSEAA
jgi:hypothetical protein